MAEPWFWDPLGNLYFVYRAKRWDTNPVRFMNNTELTAVVATAVRESGAALVIAQQPTYSAPHDGYIGRIAASDIAAVPFLSIKLVPTLAGGIDPAWAPPKTIDVVVDPQDTPPTEFRIE